MYRGFEGFLLTFIVLSSFIILYILSPIIALYLSIDPEAFHETWIEDPVLGCEAWNALLLSLEAATISTLILLITGLPLAYILARQVFPGKSLVEALIDIPLMIPHSVAGIMLIITYGGGSFLGNILSSLNIVLVDSFWGVVAAMVFVSTPLMIDTLKIGIRDVDETIEYVARSLGASRWIVFRRILLPLITPSIITGSLLSWARAISEVGAILIIAYYPKTMNILIYEWFNTYGLRYAVALSTVLITISLIVFTVFKMVSRK